MYGKWEFFVIIERQREYNACHPKRFAYNIQLVFTSQNKCTCSLITNYFIYWWWRILCKTSPSMYCLLVDATVWPFQLTLWNICLVLYMWFYWHFFLAPFKCTYRMECKWFFGVISLSNDRFGISLMQQHVLFRYTVNFFRCIDFILKRTSFGRSMKMMNSFKIVTFLPIFHVKLTQNEIYEKKSFSLISLSYSRLK